MGFGSKFKEFIGFEEEEEVISEEEIEAEAKKFEKKPEAKTEPVQSAPVKNSSLLQERLTVNNSTSPFKMVVIEPKNFDECPKLVDSLKSRKPVIINLEKLEFETAKKIFDFLNGATYALNGNVQRVTNNIYIFAPENVNIAANVEHQGIDLSGQPKSIWSK